MGKVLRFVALFGILVLMLSPLVAAIDSTIDDDPGEDVPDEGDTSPVIEDGTQSGTDLRVSEDGHVITVQEEEEIVVDLGIDFKVNYLAWDPTHAYVLIVGDDGIVVKMTIEGQCTNIPSGTTSDLWYITWKPVGEEKEAQVGPGDDYALILGSNGVLLKWQAGIMVHIMEGGSNSLTSLEWSEDGDYAIIKSEEGKVFRYPPENDQSPFIMIKEPVPNAEVSNLVTIRGLAKDPDGTILKVEVRMDLGPWSIVDGTSEWTYDMDIRDITNGVHTISARAYDGIIYSSPVVVKVDVRNDLPPSVDILTLYTGAVIMDTVQITGTAIDPEDTLDSVWVKVDDGIWLPAVGTDEWTYEFDPSIILPGSHLVTAMAFDGRYYSDQFAITVIIGDTDLDPYVVIETPVDGGTYSSTEEIEFMAIGDDFGGTELSYIWESNKDGQIGEGDQMKTTLSVGRHKLTVTVTDGALEAYASMEVTVIDTIDRAPQVSFLTPREGQTVKGIVDITGGADDDHRIVAIKVRVDSGAWRTMPGSKVWHYEWDTTGVQDGGHTLSAMASDDGRTWSEPVSIRVFVDNDKDPAVSPNLEPRDPVRDAGAPATGGLDEEGAAAVITVISCVLAVFMVISIVESIKVKLIGLFFVPLYSRIKKEKVLDNFTRGAIYGFIVANPGAHYNLIKQELKLNNGAIIYHLDILERKEFIHSEKAGIYKRYYQVGHKSKGKFLDKLTDIQKRIFLEIRGNPGVSQKDIANKLNITARALNYHIKTMLKTQLIKLERVGRRTLCFTSSMAEKTEKAPAAAI